MSPLMWYALILIAGLAMAGFCFLVACVIYEEQEGGWDD